MNIKRIFALTMVAIVATLPMVADDLDEAMTLADAYDFAAARTMLSKYEKACKKAKKPMAPEAELLMKRIERGERALNSVQKIAIVDSLTVSRRDFFKAYRIPGSAGRLTDASELPALKGKSGDVEYVFHNEQDNYLLWSQPADSLGMRLMEASRLTDGSWNVENLAEAFDIDGDMLYPFMVSDGTTLYFANDGDDSMGGYDIFKTYRDPDTAEFMDPVNMGMPFNSPFDDYLLAIDEENGLGWWATDRNLLDDELTIYVFKLTDVRENYDAEMVDDIVSLARIEDIRATWGDEDYSSYPAIIAAIERGTAPKSHDFAFTMRDGSVITSWDELPSAAVQPMKTYLAACRALEAAEKNLEAERAAYAANPRATRTDLIGLEQRVERQRSELRDTLNALCKALGFK